MSNAHTSALLQSLIEGPLLIGELPEAPPFPFHRLSKPLKVPLLNFEQKLGHLYEDALSAVLESSSQFELKEKSLQIQKDRHTTVGEVDFLLRDLETDALIHLELATKFYLAFQTDDGLALPGPDARDNYFRKIARLREHQLQLPIRHRDNLPEAYRNQKIVTQQLVYGCLFDHIASPLPATPEFLNPNCRRGKWLHQEDIPRYFSPDQKFQIIPKHLWPVSLHLLTDLKLESWQTETTIARCLMVKTPETDHCYFIAPPGYPHS